MLGRNLFIPKNEVTDSLSNRLIPALKDFSYNSSFPTISWTTDGFLVSTSSLYGLLTMLTLPQVFSTLETDPNYNFWI